MQGKCHNQQSYYEDKFKKELKFQKKSETIEKWKQSEKLVIMYFSPTPCFILISTETFNKLFTKMLENASDGNDCNIF